MVDFFCLLIPFSLISSMVNYAVQNLINHYIQWRQFLQIESLWALENIHNHKFSSWKNQIIHCVYFNGANSLYTYVYLSLKSRNLSIYNKQSIVLAILVACLWCSRRWRLRVWVWPSGAFEPVPCRWVPRPPGEVWAVMGSPRLGSSRQWRFLWSFSLSERCPLLHLHYARIMSLKHYALHHQSPNL